MTEWLDVFKSLLPRSRLWRLTVDRPFRRFMTGLANSFAAPRAYIDNVWDEVFPSVTGELSVWERQHGLPGYNTTTDRRVSLDAAWKTTGGQSPGYIQDTLHAAGFNNLFVHECWATTDPYVPLDPRDYTDPALIGTAQCMAFDAVQPQCSSGFSGSGEAIFQHQCSRGLANYPGYLVNKMLTDEAPPPIPEDPDTWPFFIYITGETFPDRAPIDMSRLNELERTLLKVCPTRHWIVLRIRDQDEDPEVPLFTFNGDDASEGWNAGIWKPS